MNKILIKKIAYCNECPYFRFEHEMEYESDGSYSEKTWYACGFTDRIIIDEYSYYKLRESGGSSLLEIPEWCTLEDSELLYKAMEAVKNS